MSPFEPHQFPVDVRFAELDPYGHLNHAVYATYFETARIAALRDTDLELTMLSEAGYRFVVMTLSIEFKRPAAANNRLLVRTWVSHTRRASSVWNQSLHRGDELLAKAEIRAAITDTNGKPTRPPEWLFERLAPLILPDQ